MSNPAAIRHEREKRTAVRAALARPVLRLDPKTLKLVVAAHDALTRQDAALFQEHGKVFDRIPADADNHVLTVAGRRLDQLEKQAEPLDTRAQKLRAHPQVRAAILAREKAEERGQ
jgi:hypothetical protein